LQILPNRPAEQVQTQSFTTKPQNIYFSDGVRAPVLAIIPQGNQLVVGQKVKAEFQTETGKPVSEILKDFPDSGVAPHWQALKGEDRIRLNPDGTIEALQAGDVTLQGTIPGLAANKGFLFIEALGRVGITDPTSGNIHWDILGMVLFYGISLYVSQIISGQNSNTGNPQQDTVNKTMPLIVSGMFLFFPLPAGVLMYMVIGNIFQTAQTFILNREPLPDNLQKMVDEQEKLDKGRDSLPFESTAAKKKEEDPKPSPKAPKAEKKTKPAANSSPKENKPSGFSPDSSKKKTSG
jgi:YidC/Oxa1 family membrane protein insertase